MKPDLWRLMLIASLLIAFGSIDFATAQETIEIGGRRIVGGEPTIIKDHPWQVALHVKKSNGRTYLCGGSIVALKWVVTAAHCFDGDESADGVKAKAGVTDYVADGTWTEIERIVVHQGYNDKTHENDIALLKFKRPPSGRVIPLAEPAADIPLQQPLEVTGWGATSENGKASHVLLKATVPYVATDTCNEPASYDGHIKTGMLCAGKREGGIDSCQGDSGGPLVWNTTDGPVLVGVVSFGDGCARKLKYGVYTRVSSYREWIDRVVEADQD